MSTNPRVLIVTPEVTYLPPGMGAHSSALNARAGGLADVSATLINALYCQGADVHVALPCYRAIFNGHYKPQDRKKINNLRDRVSEERIHLAQDRVFYYLSQVYSGDALKNINISLAFQREVINNIVPKIQPDLIHCNDWMTALIPAMARRLNIPCLFTIHNIHTVKCLLSTIEERGIDSASFWQNLFFKYYPSSYENSRDDVPVDFLASGVFASHFVNTVSPTFLTEMIQGRHGFVNDALQRELANKSDARCAVGILNAPDPSYNPTSDAALVYNYSSANHIFGKKANKKSLQKTLGLTQDSRAPLFFWPHRLDPAQKGCQLLSGILYDVVSRYWDQNLEMVFVADGVFQDVFNRIVRFHGFSHRVAVCGFNERLARLAYGASDFVLMPSVFEPCGLPQMIGPIYGALPVAHDTGGIHDTVDHLDAERDSGNGFLFETFDEGGLSWAIDQAMQFFMLPLDKKKRQITRIMMQSALRFSHKVTAKHYIDLYEKMLQRPLVQTEIIEARAAIKNQTKKKSNLQTIVPLLTPRKEMTGQGLSDRHVSGAL